VTAAALGAAIAALLLAGLHKGVSPRVLAQAPVALVSFVYVVNPVYRVFSFHGFYHVPIVYGLMNGDFPPHDPFFAGSRLLYPWVYECLAAMMSWAAGVIPPTSFAVINVVALALCVRQTLRIARLLGFDDTSACLAVWLAFFGTTPLNIGPAADLLNPYLPFPMEFRGTPPLVIFTTPTGATVAIAFFLLAIEVTIRAACEEPPDRRRTLVIILLSLVATGLVYPLMYLALAAGIVIAAGAFWRRGRSHSRLAAGMIAIVSTATVVVLPYFLLIGRGKAPGERLALVSTFPGALAGFESYLTTVLPAALLVFSQRSRVSESFRPGRWPFLVLLSFFVGASAVFVLLHAPQATQYKSRILASVALGVLCVGALRAVYDRRPMVCLLILSVLFIPLGSVVLLTTGTDWKPTDRWLEKGWELVHADPAQQGLYDWILRETKRRDIFIDSYLTVPVFARRALYCAVDIRREQIPGARPHDGFGFPPAVWFSEVFGYPKEQIDQRAVIVYAIYSATERPLAQGAFEALRKQALDVDLYVIARDPPTKAKLSADARFEWAFANDAATVFRLRKARP
jgi:hypothetical protein